MISKQEYQHALIYKEMAEKMNEAVPQQVLDTIAAYEKQQSAQSDTPIYATLKANAKFPVTPEKERCVRQTVDKLLQDGPRAQEPGLLLGKIQCGKTDTFENIIGLAFDRGIDIVIVLTKGTNALVEQTIKRMDHDYRFFKENDDLHSLPTIHIEDIMNSRKGFNKERIDSSKTVVVAKKETTNLKYLIRIFERDEWMRQKRVLIVDDEADFASRNYSLSHPQAKYDEDGEPVSQKRRNTLAKVSGQIDELRRLPAYCRYLQVTATPYCLFLQPDGNIEVEEGQAMAFRPRFTSLVPIHDRYIGGQQYFVDSRDPESMYSHLYQPISQKCIDVLGHEDKRYLKSGIASGNIQGLSRALISYLMATAIRRIQRRAIGKNYKSSAVIHVNIDRDNHAWQDRLISFMREQLCVYFTGKSGDDPRLDFLVGDIYGDFSESSRKARERGQITDAFPTLEQVKAEVADIFASGGINQKVVNSDNDMRSLLNPEDGQLRLDSTANIFIGGSILDRGITINNMLCFFYGRNPEKFQQDTVLQHARFYGARDLEDMAVTRLHTSADIHRALARMNELDEQLRQQFLTGLDKADPYVTFVGYDKSFRPCAPSKIRPARALTLKSGKIFVPTGMWTGSEREIGKTVREIDRLITESPGYGDQDSDGFFHMDAERAMNILRLIETTFRYDQKYGNQSEKNDMRELMSVLHYCANGSKSDVLVLHRTDRNMSRIRESGEFITGPANGIADLEPARRRSGSTPVLMLLRQNGNKMTRAIGVDAAGREVTANLGWNNAPFYWPLVMAPGNTGSMLFAIDQKEDPEVTVVEFGDLIEGIDPSEVLSLTFRGDLVERFGAVGTEYPEVDKAEVEHRAIRITTAPKFLVRTPEWGFRDPDVAVDNEDEWAGVYTHNGGRFPFKLRDYKYMLLRSGRTGAGEGMLLELYPRQYWKVVANKEFTLEGNLMDLNGNTDLGVSATDTLISPDGEELDYTNPNLCLWEVDYPIRRVLRHHPRPNAPAEEGER